MHNSSYEKSCYPADEDSFYILRGSLFVSLSLRKIQKKCHTRSYVPRIADVLGRGSMHRCKGNRSVNFGPRDDHHLW